MKPAPLIGATLLVGTLSLLAVPIVTVVGVLLLVTAATPSSAEPGALSDEVPAAYRQAILAAAAACPGLPAALLAAQLAAESGWNPDAVSPAGALGLAQFMPGTWATWGRDGDADDRADALNPLDAIAAQGALMCDLLQRAQRTGWGDPLDLVLAGYNAGWGALQQHRGIPPYPETTGYIARIRELMPRYVGSTPELPGVGMGEAVWPVRDPNPITNDFGNRPEGIDYELGYHTGIDLNADRRLGGSDYGEPVLAARVGTVYAIEHGGPLGNQVLIGHPDGYYSAYAHLATITVRTGQQLAAGQQVGTIGCSGMSTCGPHLHFEVRRSPRWAQGNFVDPLEWLGLGRP